MASLTQLEYVVAVDQCRHFGRAAAMSNVSQPTLSAQLQKLEDEIGVVLFDRSKQPVLPTEQGQPLIEQARVILSEVGRFHKLAGNADEMAGEFRLAVIPTIAPYLMPTFLKEFALRFPSVQLFVEELPTEKVIEALDRDRIDAGIVATPLGLTRVEERPLYYEPFRVYAGSDHPLAQIEKVSPGMLDPGQLWLLSEEHCLRQQVIVVCGSGTQRGNLPSVHLKGGSLETVVELVASGQGYTLLPQLAAESFAARQFPGKVIPMTRPEPAREVSLVFRRGYLKQRLLEHVRETIESGLPDGLPRKPSRQYQVLGLMGQFK